MGKCADVVVLKNNLCEVESHRIAATGVEMTIRNERFTHSDSFAAPPPNG